MISVVIATHNAEQTLGAALGGLMRAAIDGHVREVVIVDAGSTDATLAIADDAGADIVNLAGDVGSRLAAGCTRTRSPWLLTLPLTGRMLPGWEVVTAQHMERPPEQAAWFPLIQAGWLKRLAGPGDGVALLMPRRLYDQSGGFVAGAGEGRLARRLGKPVRLAVPVLPPT